MRLERGARAEALRALGWLMRVRLLLAMRSYAAVRRSVTRVEPRRPGAARMSAEQCDAALERALRLMPRTRCLVRSLAAECLLRSEGHAAQLRIGVRLDPARQLLAHAWVETGDAAFGAEHAAEYASLIPPRAP